MDNQQQPVRDQGLISVASHVLDDSDIRNHRSTDAVYIGLHVPKRKHRHKRHKHRKVEGDKTQSSQPEVFKDVANPAQRVQFLLGEEEDEEHKAHDLFCEMEELFYNGDQMEWKESARWIKFEEDVEEGGERWSKPHVATLSLHSLFELRCNILNGTVMFDIEPYDLPSLVELVVDTMVASKQLEENLKEQFVDTMLIRHRHQNQKKPQRSEENGGSKLHLPLIRSFAEIGRKSSVPSFHKHAEDPSNPAQILKNKFKSAKSSPNFHAPEKQDSGPLEHHPTYSGSLTANQSSSDLLTRDSSHKDLSHMSNHSLHFMKKIPPGAEAANILVGEVEFLNHPVVAFVRLLHSIILRDLTEVPVPTKFVFILLGPMGGQSKYHEIGRSIATLMSDEVFHDVAYHARNRDDLLAGIDEFLDQVTVLPPGEWDPSIRIEPPKQIPSQESRRNNCYTPPAKTEGGDPEEVEIEMDHVDSSLVRTGRLCGGIVNDIKRKLPFYASDFKDALHVQCLASFIFLYFACLTPVITFGGLLNDATDGNMAVFESILAAAICGIFYALLSGQPLTILGSTGPVLVFETILHHFCKDNGWDYLEFRLWVGLWTGILLIIMVILDLSAWVQYITRFTEESFALLISLIFIKEAFAKLAKVTLTHPIHFPIETRPGWCQGRCNPPLLEEISNDTLTNVTMASNTVPVSTTTISTLSNTTDNTTSSFDMTAFWANKTLEECVLSGGHWDKTYDCHSDTEPEVFFLSVILFTGTFLISMTLKRMRTSKFFPTQIRGIINDFAVMIAIVMMVLIDFLLGIPTPKLHVPQEFRPTSDKRTWVVNPIDKNPWYLPIAAVIPALLATILIFMDQQITAVIVNRKENKLVKGKGYHLDLFIVACLIIICSFLGLPFFVAATVLSITHVMSLKKESKCAAPGEAPKFLGVREQRVTGFMINLMIGISILLTGILKHIPMPVLYGVFLYMGVSSLRGMQIVNRILIWFMPQKYQPDYMYLRHVPTKRVHLFTAIQVMCLVILWIVKSIKDTSIVFPLMVLAMCFVRKGLDWVFTQDELRWLDDIMPEIHNRNKEDEDKELKDQEEKEKEMASLPNGSSSSNSLHMNVVKVGINTPDSDLCISDEVTKTSLWKSIVANESSPSLASNNSVTKHRKHKSSKNKSSGQGVSFYIDEEEKEHLLSNNKAPEIVVDPPSRDHSDNEEKDSKM
ncbi:sodium bicarbonate cotransporter 3-like isoform X1 [Saccostrea cucullata]|uniref:sodium bicarbonate cotransporter 3-like isoform X1 n=1 Tax=Saccostrea cuccullata TaxID=36930 RepID=UPI002ED36B9C